MTCMEAVYRVSMFGTHCLLGWMVNDLMTKHTHFYKLNKTRGTADLSSLIPRKVDFHSVCTRNPLISVIIWYKPRDYARPPAAGRHPLT